LQLLDLDVLRTPGRGGRHYQSSLRLSACASANRRRRVQAALRDIPRDPHAVAFRVGRLLIRDAPLASQRAAPRARANGVLNDVPHARSVASNG
jgi:hypothetical protein